MGSEMCIRDRIHAVAGLGNPGRFFDTLSQLNFDIERHPFPDHHQFEQSDLEFLDHHPIIMTEKDAARCKNFDNPRIWYLTVEPKIEESFINDLESRIRSLPSDE